MGIIIKKESKEEITQADLKKINEYTRREFKKEEVYIFSIVLCDNDIDRDYERFTVESLFALEKLFVGKTGILDHSPKAENQTARIFECAVEAVEGQKTQTGDQYFHLIAKAYLPICKKNREFILALDSGIQKEVSVGCKVKQTRCSICGKESGCTHKRGETYGGKLCFFEMINPDDAYEWSFVAVPSQRRAGVIKSFEYETRETNMENILKSIKSSGTVTLSEHEAKKLHGYISSLEKAAEDGKAYKKELQGAVCKLFAIVQPEIKKATAEALTEKMSISELIEFKSAFGKKSAGMLTGKPQLITEAEKKTEGITHTQFTI